MEAGGQFLNVLLGLSMVTEAVITRGSYKGCPVSAGFPS